MADLFEREQKILEDSILRLNEIQKGTPCTPSQYASLVREYDKLLRQLRRMTKISDKTTIELNAKKLDLLDKVHYDGLTGIYNRRFMDENLQRIIKTVSCDGGMLSVLMIDVDFFKKFNDTYGHSMGDDCLRRIANILNDGIKGTDEFVARYGGEEFVVVLPNTDKNDACVLADNILKNVRGCNIPHENNDAASCVTISIGITTSDAGNRYRITDADCIKRADEALYISKKSGRNRYTYLEFKEEENDIGYVGIL